MFHRRNHLLLKSRSVKNVHSPDQSVIRSRPRFDTPSKIYYPRQNRQMYKSLRQKYNPNQKLFFPGQQMRHSQTQHVKRVANKLKITDSEAYYRNYSMTKLMKEANARFGENADDWWIKKGSYNELRQAKHLKSLEGLGDDEPLSMDPDLGFSKLDIAAHGRKGAFERIAPPVPYSKRMSRRMAEGTLWPTVHGTEDMALKQPRMMKHPDNMSPSEKRFSYEVEYWLRRNLRAMPAHLAEQMDFNELIIDHCFVSRRCKELFIVWSTVTGAARLKMEPLMVHLNSWVIRTIKRRMKHTPNIPQVYWVYNSGAIQTEMPNKLRHQLNTVLANHSTSIEQRVDYLRQLDSMEHRMKGIPWFMPYLWGKEQKVAQSGQMRKDFVAVKDQREKLRQNAESKADKYSATPNYVA